MKELGPDEGINRLSHPDCRACKEHLAVGEGLLQENAQLKKKLAELQQGGDAIGSGTPGHHVAEGGSVQCDGVALAQVITDIERQLDPRIDPAAYNAYAHCRGLLKALTQQSCICNPKGLGFDSPDPLKAKPCPVHSPEYFEQSSGGQEAHAYLSTACLHDLHDRCRLNCKFCEVPCRCSCHSGGQEGGVEEGADR